MFQKLRQKKNQQPRLSVKIITFLGVLLVVGCDSSSNREELEMYVKRVESLSSNKKAEKLPDELPDLTFKYEGLDKRSPFETPEEFVRGQINYISDENMPDMARTKEVLEKFDVKELKMVGSLKKTDGTSWALVKDAQNMIYKVKVGSYIGKNFGKVTKVSDKEIEINELVSDSYGGWKNNTVLMPLNE